MKTFFGKWHKFSKLLRSTNCRFADLVKNPEKHYPGGGIHFAVWYRKAVMDAHAVYRSMW